MTQTQDQGRGGGGGGGRGGGGGGRQQQQQQGGRAGGQGANAGVGNATWWLEYDFATQTVVLNDKYKPEETGTELGDRVARQEDVVYSRNFNLFMMDAENFEKAKKNAGDHVHRRDAAHDRRRAQLRLRPRRRRRQPGSAAGQHADRAGRRRAPAAATRSSRARPTRNTAAAHDRRRRLLVAGQQEVLGHAHRPAQGRRSLGHQRARESAPDARDLQVRHARRGEPAAGRAARRRPRREEGAEDQDRGVQGSADGAGDRADDQPAAREGRGAVALAAAGQRQDRTTTARAAI